MIEIRLPKPGPEFDEATITSWERQEGDKIETGDILAIIKTPLGSFKVAAEEEGVLSKISQNANDRINFDEPIAVLDSPEDSLNGASPEPDDDTLPLPIDEALEEPAPIVEEVKEEVAEEALVEDSPEVTSEESAEPTEEPSNEGASVSISPAAKKLAEKFGIDYTQLTGTGQDGKILYIDVENAVNEGPPPSATKTENKATEVTEEAEKTPLKIKWDEPEPDSEANLAELPNLEISQTPVEPENSDQDFMEPVADVTSEPVSENEDKQPEEVPKEEIASTSDKAEDSDVPFPDYEEISIQFHLAKREDLIIPFNSVKKKYAETQALSKKEIPHFYLFAEVDFTKAKEWRKAYNAHTKGKVTVTDMLVKSVGHALALMPEMNAHVKKDRLILKRSINVGVTTSVDEGVVMPVVPDVYHKSLLQVSEAVKKNAELANTTKVVIDYDATFTISNLGMYGVSQFIPVIVPPQTCNLAVGEIQKKIVPTEDFLGIRYMMNITLACDHRAIDGVTAAKFIELLKSDIENLEPGTDPDWINGNDQLRLI